MVKATFCRGIYRMKSSSCFKKGQIPWNKGKRYSCKHSGQFKGGFTPWNKGKHPDYVQGKNHPMYGKTHSEETRKRLSLSHKGQHNSPSTEFKKGNKSWNKSLTKEQHPILAEISRKNSSRYGKNTSMYGKYHSKKTKMKMKEKRIANPIKFCGKEHWNWQGGIGNKPYPLGWTNTFKEQIRSRDGYKCQICGCPEVECFSKLHVHHIDYNKENLDKNNLISLCISCHVKTNKNRDCWKKYFLKEVKR